MALFPFSLPGLGAPAVSPGVQRPFDAFALRRAANATPGCGPLENGLGLWTMAECFLPVVAASSSVPMRTTSPQADAPLAVDLRSQGLDGPVKDQQRVGVCWAFAMSTVMENALRRQGRADVVAPLHVIATDALRDIFMKGTTDGPMTLEPSWNYDPVKACKLKSDPEPWCGEAYHVEQGSWRNDPILVGEVDRANKTGVVTVVGVQKLQQNSFEAIATVLAEGRAAYLGFDLSKGWHSAWGIDSVPDYTVADGGKHAVVAVGYRTNGPRGREVLIHNSWGESWGAGGFAWLSEDAVRRHNIDAFVLDVKALGLAAPNPSGGGGFPFPFPLPLPGLGAPAPGPSQPGQTCGPEQVKDVLTGACAARCANGASPVNGLCVGF